MKKLNNKIDLLISKVNDLKNHQLTKKEAGKIANLLGDLADKLEAKLANSEKTKKAV